MRTRIFGLVLAVAVLPQAAMAGGDICYGPETERFEAQDTAKKAEPLPKMKFEDRSWATAGVEESMLFAEAGTTVLDFSFPTLIEESPNDRPRMFDDAVWPRTRELFHEQHLVRQVDSTLLASSEVDEQSLDSLSIGHSALSPALKRCH